VDRKHLLAAMISALCLNTFCDPPASEDGAEEVDEGESSRPGSRAVRTRADQQWTTSLEIAKD
jgi:hypothetical protein